MIKSSSITKEYVLIFFILLMASTIIYSYNVTDYGFLNPDEAILFKYTSMYKDNGMLYERDPLNSQSGLEIYKGRGDLVINGNTYSGKFLGFPFFVGADSILFNRNTIHFFTIFMAGFCFLW